MKTAYLAPIPLFFLLACGGRSALDDLEVVNPGSGTVSGDSGGGSTGTAGSSSSSSSSQGTPSGGTPMGGQAGNGGEADSGTAASDSGSTTGARPPVSCGDTACDSAQECCLEVDLTGTTSTCIDQGAACPTGIALSCTNRTDCADGDVCCVDVADRLATCQVECALAGGISGAGVELCSTTIAGAGCPAGELCVGVPTTSLAVCVPELGALPGAAEFGAALGAGGFAAAGAGAGAASGGGAGAGGAGVRGAGGATGAGGH